MRPLPRKGLLPKRNLLKRPTPFLIWTSRMIPANQMIPQVIRMIRVRTLQAMTPTIQMMMSVAASAAAATDPAAFVGGSVSRTAGMAIQQVMTQATIQTMVSVVVSAAATTDPTALQNGEGIAVEIAVTAKQPQQVMTPATIQMMNAVSVAASGVAIIQTDPLDRRGTAAGGAATMTTMRKSASGLMMRGIQSESGVIT